MKGERVAETLEVWPRSREVSLVFLSLSLQQLDLTLSKALVTLFNTGSSSTNKEESKGEDEEDTFPGISLGQRVSQLLRVSCGTRRAASSPD